MPAVVASSIVPDLKVMKEALPRLQVLQVLGLQQEDGEQLVEVGGREDGVTHARAM